MAADIPDACIKCEFPWTMNIREKVTISEGYTGASFEVDHFNTRCSRCSTVFMSSNQGLLLMRQLAEGFARTQPQALSPTELFQALYHKKPKGQTDAV
jgi:hypothetical protein